MGLVFIDFVENLCVSLFTKSQRKSSQFVLICVEAKPWPSNPKTRK